jgi:hypothetical protein
MDLDEIEHIEYGFKFWSDRAKDWIHGRHSTENNEELQSQNNLYLYSV